MEALAPQELLHHSINSPNLPPRDLLFVVAGRIQIQPVPKQQPILPTMLPRRCLRDPALRRRLPQLPAQIGESSLLDFHATSQHFLLLGLACLRFLVLLQFQGQILFAMMSCHCVAFVSAELELPSVAVAVAVDAASYCAYACYVNVAAEARLAADA